MNLIAKLLDRLFPRYRVTAVARPVIYAEADRRLSSGNGWRLAREEDFNNVPGVVWLERVELRPRAKV